MRSLVLLTCVCALGVAFSGGCDKKFSVEFTNYTSENLEVAMEGPGRVRPAPPSTPIEANGGKAMFSVKVDPDELPANYYWKAGSHHGAVVVLEESPKARFVHVAENRQTHNGRSQYIEGLAHDETYSPPGKP